MKQKKMYTPTPKHDAKLNFELIRHQAIAYAQLKVLSYQTQLSALEQMEEFIWTDYPSDKYTFQYEEISKLQISKASWANIVDYLREAETFDQLCNIIRNKIGLVDEYLFHFIVSALSISPEDLEDLEDLGRKSG